MIHYTQYIIIAEYLRVRSPRVSLSGSIKGFNVVQEKVKISKCGSIKGFNVVQEKVKISKCSKFSKQFQNKLKIIKSNLFSLNVQNFQNF